MVAALWTMWVRPPPSASMLSISAAAASMSPTSVRRVVTMAPLASSCALAAAAAVSSPW